MNINAGRWRQRLRESLKVALSSRDTIATAALRAAISAIDNAEAVDPSHAPAPTRGMIGDVRLGVGAGEAARRELSTQDVVEIVRGEIRERTEAAAEYERLGRAEQANRLNAEASALQSFLETTTEKP
jgi:uncharacterized protein YqeY